LKGQGAYKVQSGCLSPTKEILDGYKNRKITWDEYKRRFSSLLSERKVEEIIDRELFRVSTVLLCSEPRPEKCHRRLVAEHLRDKWGDVDVIHL
jgi:uncharacterized protein (DUF488 family)